MRTPNKSNTNIVKTQKKIYRTNFRKSYQSRIHMHASHTRIRRSTQASHGSTAEQINMATSHGWARCCQRVARLGARDFSSPSEVKERWVRQQHLACSSRISAVPPRPSSIPMQGSPRTHRWRGLQRQASTSAASLGFAPLLASRWRRCWRRGRDQSSYGAEASRGLAVAWCCVDDWSVLSGARRRKPPG